MGYLATLPPTRPPQKTEQTRIRDVSALFSFSYPARAPEPALLGHYIVRKVLAQLVAPAISPQTQSPCPNMYISETLQRNTVIGDIQPVFWKLRT